MIYSHADDGHKVYFNPNGPDPAGKIQITYYSPGCCLAYGANGIQYGPVTLQAGVPYYIEGIYKEGGGGDWMAVAAKLASDPTDPASLSDIPGKYLASLGNPDAAGEIVVATAPQSVSTYINQFATFSVDATSSLGYSIFYQWQKSIDGGNTWVDIVNANTKKLTVGPLTIDDNGALFRVQMSVPGKIVTLQASLTVTEDNGTARFSKSLWRWNEYCSCVLRTNGHKQCYRPMELPDSRSKWELSGSKRWYISRHTSYLNNRASDCR